MVGNVQANACRPRPRIGDQDMGGFAILCPHRRRCANLWGAGHSDTGEYFAQPASQSGDPVHAALQDAEGDLIGFGKLFFLRGLFLILCNFAVD